MSRRTYVHRPGHPKANDCGMVALEDLGGSPAPQADGRSDTNFMVGRFYEGLRGPGGEDWSTRAKRKEDQRVRGWVDADDCKGLQQQREKNLQNMRDRMAGKAPPPKELVEHVGRVAYELKHRGKR